MTPKAEKGQADGRCVSPASGENLCLPGQFGARGPRGGGAGTGWRLQSQPLKATLCPSVYSASNLLVLLNDGILRKELRKKLPVVRIVPETEGQKQGPQEQNSNHQPVFGARVMVS